MEYYKVKAEFAERTFGEITLINNELMTKEEVETNKLPLFCFVKVDVPEERTCCFFCARFDDNDGNEPWNN